MKKYFFLSVTIVAAAALGFILFSPFSVLKEEKSPAAWRSFKKESSGKIVKFNTPDTDKLFSNTGKKRSPASVKTHERSYLGKVPNQFGYNSLEFLNKVNDNWEELLGDELLRFHNDGTSAHVKWQKAHVRMIGDKGQFVEEVVITYKSPDGETSNFRALVDSETGKVVRTWAFDIKERKNRDKFVLKSSPFNSEF